MGLLKVIMNSVEVHAQSGSQSQLTDLAPRPALQDVTADAHIDTSGFEMTSQGSTFAAEKEVDSATLLLSIPETELRLLSSLLACEGLSKIEYSHAADVSMKLLKVAPPHQHLFITELSNAAERLSKVAAGVTLYGDLQATDILKLPKASSFHHEYSSMACTEEII